MNAAERPRAPLPVFGIVQLRTARKKPLVRDAVVPRQHLKMSRQVHSSELTSESARVRSRFGHDERRDRHGSCRCMVPQNGDLRQGRSTATQIYATARIETWRRWTPPDTGRWCRAGSILRIGAGRAVFGDRDMRIATLSMRFRLSGAMAASWCNAGARKRWSAGSKCRIERISSALERSAAKMT